MRLPALCLLTNKAGKWYGSLFGSDPSVRCSHCSASLRLRLPGQIALGIVATLTFAGFFIVRSVSIDLFFVHLDGWVPGDGWWESYYLSDDQFLVELV